MARTNPGIAMSGQPIDVIGPYRALQETRRANRLAQLQERQVAMAEQELAREQERQARVQNALAQLATPDLPQQQRQATTLRLYGDDPRVAAGVSAEFRQAQELQRQRQIEEARQHYLEADYVIRNPQFAVEFFRRRRPDEYAQVAQQLGREPTTEDVIRLAHLSRAQYGAIAGIDPMATRSDLPASVQEWQFFSALPPEQQQRYLQMKRATDRVVEIGGVPTLVQTGVQPTTRALSTLEQEIGAAAQKERAKTTAKEQAEADVKALTDLPTIEQSASYLTQLLTALETHPGLSAAVGVKGPTNWLPGTAAADFKVRLEQIRGMQFLEAYQKLRGGGQITEVEGQKAEQAIARISTAQSEKEFLNAVREFRGMVERALERARQRAAQAAQNLGRYTGAPNDQAGAGSPAPPAAAGPSAPTQTPTPVRVGTKEQYDALPSGTVFVAPDGSMRVKP